MATEKCILYAALQIAIFLLALFMTQTFHLLFVIHTTPCPSGSKKWASKRRGIVDYATSD